MSAKTPSHVDHQVGRRIRQARRDAKLTQEQLGNMIGLTFQQVQKYEKGVNRIGASRLYEVSRILNVPVQYFYEEMAEGDVPARNGEMAFAEGDGTPYVMDFVSSSEGLQLNRAFFDIKDPTVRRSVIDLLKNLSKAQREAE